MLLDPRIPKEFHDFRNLQRIAWAAQRWKPPDYRAQEMIEAFQWGPKRLVMTAPRGSTKSGCSYTAALGFLLHDRNLKVSYGSSTPALAKKTTHICMKLIEKQSVFRPMYPGDKARWSSEEGFDVAGCPPALRDCSFTPFSLLGTQTGSRAGLLILDDPENEKNCLTTTMRTKLRASIEERFEFLETDGDTRVWVPATPHTEETVIRFFLDRGFTQMILTARYPTKAYFQRIEDRLFPSLKKDMEEKPELMIGGGKDGDQGQPANPERYSEEFLQSKEHEVGPLNFRLQWMLDTEILVENEFPLRLADLIVADLDADGAYMKMLYGREEEWDIPCVGFSRDHYFKPASMMGWSLYEVKAMFVDPAGRGKDETGYTILGVLNGQYFVLENGGLGGDGASEEDRSYDAKVRTLTELAIRWKVAFVKVEDDFGDGMFGTLLSPILEEESEKAGLRIGLIQEKAKGNKEKRIIDTLDPVMGNHQLIVNRAVVEGDYRSRRMALNARDAENFMLFFQMSHITKQKNSLIHDDRLDSLAMGVRHFRDLAKTRQNLEMARRADMRLEMGAQAFWDWSNGIGPQPENDVRTWNHALL